LREGFQRTGHPALPHDEFRVHAAFRRGPDFFQIDASLSKQIAIDERASLEYRGEAFNLFNRPQYGQPYGDITVPTQFGIIASTVNTTPVGTGTPRQMQLWFG